MATDFEYALLSAEAYQSTNPDGGATIQPDENVFHFSSLKDEQGWIMRSVDGEYHYETLENGVRSCFLLFSKLGSLDGTVFTYRISWRALSCDGTGKWAAGDLSRRRRSVELHGFAT
jgi:hypothetical protein